MWWNISKDPCFLHSILNPCNEWESDFAAWQEGRRKDIERAICVLQTQSHIIALPSRLWNKGVMRIIMYCCVIINNMVVTDELPLVPLESGNLKQDSIDVGESVEHCFVQNNVTPNRPIPGTISAICATHTYLHSVKEYMNTPLLDNNLICSEWRRK